MRVTTPPLRVHEVEDRVRLALGGLTIGEGTTLQEAADDLVHRLLVMVMACRNTGIGPISSECMSNYSEFDFLWELGEIAAQGGDIRARLFGK
jgi:hypothetical protein